jgi:hypothetical protein
VPKNEEALFSLVVAKCSLVASQIMCFSLVAKALFSLVDSFSLTILPVDIFLLVKEPDDSDKTSLLTAFLPL